jgi:zinc-finger-containing domain
MIKVSDLNQKQIDMLHALRCPICGSGTKEMTETQIYGREYKGVKMIACENYPKCNSYVGTHKDTGIPLGRLADHELRIARKEAHDVFDRLWKLAHMTRQQAYEELSSQLDLDPYLTHFAYFSKDTCLKAKNWAVIRLMSFDK